MPAGWLAYTHTLPGGDLSSWVQPMLAVNHTLKIGSDDAALGDPSMDLSTIVVVEVGACSDAVGSGVARGHNSTPAAARREAREDRLHYSRRRSVERKHADL